VSDPRALIAAGRLAEAAVLLEQQGHPERAIELYEQLWDYAAATRAARAARDLPRALSCALRGKDAATIQDLLANAARTAATAEACAAACEERSAWAPAARLYEAAGVARRAADCHERAGALNLAARACEAAGDTKRALELHRRHLSELGDAVTDDEVLGYGRLLLRFGRAEEALPLLQRAWRGGGAASAEAGRAAVVGLARLGYAHAATLALARLGGSAPTMRQCLDDPRFAPMRGQQAEHTLAGRYRLGALIGSGGMGRVYIATDLLSEQEVAVKVFVAPGGARGRDAYRRFLKEARTTGQLQHPHIVSLLDFNEEMGFMVLEYMSGGSLADRLRGPLALATCRSVLLQVTSGLAAAQQRGVIHRDLKPSNIFFSGAGAAKLGDFGVAHLQDSGQTQTGAFVGTVAFMSPEQITGDPITFATDIYSLGVTFFLMLTGQLPFNPPDLVAQHLHATPPKPSTRMPGLSPLCDELVLRCLGKRPEERFESLAALRRVLEALPTEAPILEVAGSAGRSETALQPQQASAGSRFSVEATLLDDAELQVLDARDDELGRAVTIVRLGPGAVRDARLAVIRAAAVGGDEHLQRVLSLDTARGVAVLETRLGQPPALPASDLDTALEVVAQLGLALAPLHRAGIAHGAVAPAAVTTLGGDLILSLVPALARRAGATPRDDVCAALALVGLDAPVAAQIDGTALAAWAAVERSQHEQASRDERLACAVRTALDEAPPEVRR
jgi:eukaryotic-like serine/threonine-protein kinase